MDWNLSSISYKSERNRKRDELVILVFFLVHLDLWQCVYKLIKQRDLRRHLKNIVTQNDSQTYYIWNNTYAFSNSLQCSDTQHIADTCWSSLFFVWLSSKNNINQKVMFWHCTTLNCRKELLCSSHYQQVVLLPYYCCHFVFTLLVFISLSPQWSLPQWRRLP